VIEGLELILKSLSLNFELGEATVPAKCPATALRPSLLSNYYKDGKMQLIFYEKYNPLWRQASLPAVAPGFPAR